MKWEFTQEIELTTSTFKCELDADTLEEAKVLIEEGGYEICQPITLNIKHIGNASEPVPIKEELA